MSGGKFARKRQRKPLPLRFLALRLLNAVLVALAIVFAVKLHHVTHLLITQSAAEVWKGQSTENFVQVSAFQPVNQPITETDVETFHQTLQQKFVDASLEAPENGSLYQDAWSTTARDISVSTASVSYPAKTIRVGGAFFLFHPLPLRSGSYISNRDFTYDRVVLDEELSWALFGSYDVAGQTVWIQNEPYVVAGVVSREKDKASGKAYADGAGMFISYSAMRHITGGEENTDPGISCYELVMAEPITGFGLSVLRESFPTKDVSVFVQNTDRYSLKSLLTVVSQFGERSMNTAGVIFPYWENAARYTEDHAALDLVLLVLMKRVWKKRRKSITSGPASKQKNPRFHVRSGDSGISGLFDFESAAGGLFLLLLRKSQGQDAVLVACLDVRAVDAADIKAAAVGAERTLAAQEAVLLFLLLKLGMTLGGDAQGVVLYIDVDVFLLEAGQISLQRVAVSGVLDIGFQFAQRTVGEEGSFQIVEILERVVYGMILAVIRY